VNRIYNFLHSVILIVLSVSMANNIKAQSSIPPLSDVAHVSLLTFDPGTEAYTVWGHTAIRIRDEARGMDVVFNYGTFDFDEPYFLLKFLRGKLNYSLSFAPLDKVLYYYKHYKRGIHEQVLNLSPEEKNRLYNLLLENYKPENRYYKYDFFFDNCSTRPLNILEKSIDGKLILGQSKDRYTFRELLDNQIKDYKWLDFGIDLIIGNKADKIPTDKQSAFLPLNLMHRISKAKIQIATPGILSSRNAPTNATTKPLVIKEKTILKFKNKAKATPWFISPIWIFTYLFLLEIVIFYFSYRKGQILYKRYDFLWFFIAALGGLIIVFLWFFTDHQATKNNWNLLWLNPLYILLFFRKTRKAAAYILNILLFITLVAYSFIPQQLHPASIPIMGLLMLKVAKYGLLKEYFSS